MRSILAKVVLWSLGTFFLSLVAFWAVERMLAPHGPPQADPFWGMVRLVEEDACRAYEQGGPAALAAHLKRLDERLPGRHYLTDLRGRDLVDGTDRSGLMRTQSHGPGPPKLADGHIVLVGPPQGGGRYRFITVARPWFGPPNILPYYGIVVLVIVAMGAILAMNLAAPLRRLRDAVERFGRGDLFVRTRSRRRDEIGALARSFDEMAGRIETLLSAERRLLQDISHELRSPLARLGFAVALARTGDDRGAALDRIQRDVDRLSALVGELLELTRAEGDPAARERAAVRLDDLLRMIADDAAIEAHAKGCRIMLNAPIACTVRGDGELLRRALENVLRNAVRHTPEGTSVDVDLSAGGSSADVTIRDCGPGVPDAALTAVFEPFFRVDDARSPSSGGLGLGLAIARRAVALHDGTIVARNADPGLCVTVSLPLSAG